MATVSTPATLSSVKTVLGGAGTLRRYLRGDLTPNINHFSAIPTSGSITLSSFAGKIYPVVNLPIVSAQSSKIGGATATTGIEYSNGGTAYRTGNGVATPGTSTWLLAGAASNYEIQLIRTLGDTPTGSAVNTWLALSTTRGWYLSTAPSGSKVTDGWLLIRDTLTNVSLGNVAFSMDASAEF